ncbi:MAG: ABC transporter ATP-binding protein [Xenococcaceae cyanobacterium MO_167.B27]|nr:ABC transporter ATP-binding protein [Xenococcaceae cyanobacterium MO_167.B27]
MPTLIAKNLCKSFGGHHVLQNVNFELSAPGIVALIGPNGAGKTTLLNILTGFLSPDAGHCALEHQEITHLPPHKIVQLGAARTFQDLRLIRQVSVLENVLLARPHQRGESLIYALLRFGVAKQEKRNRQVVMELLRFVGLQKMSRNLGSELSYGQQKLLSLACCLATEAKVLLLDEPVAGVNPNLGSKILELMLQLRNEGKLIVFIEHDIQAVRQIADCVMVMDAGKIITQGTPTEILSQSKIMEVYLD